MALYVASHYKNQPSDFLSDAPAHLLFVLLPPIKDDESHLPELLVVLQVALEGRISQGIRDIRMAIYVDNIIRGLTSDFDLDLEEDCGLNVYLCAKGNFSGRSSRKA